ncbi:MAG: class I SAM-dependent methyltransferase [Candidatus Rokubacteria bacterium]|nr:class I SAM-dependent methyltransferase [Candidatus Rokubacteria bacterium]
MDAPVFPWTLGEVRASLALCPPAAFHITGLRLERLGPERWWADLVGYRDDLGAPFTWQGFRIHRGRGWEVTPPPYLADLDGVWRALVFGTVQRLSATALGDPTGVRAEALFVCVERPSGIPGPGNAGSERVVPAEPSVAAWLRRAKRYRFAAHRLKDRSVLALDAGPGSRMLARLARRVVAVDTSLAALQYMARAYRSPRLHPAAAGEGRWPFRDGTFDAVVGLDLAADAGPAVLAEAARVLKPEGELVAGTASPAALAQLQARLAGEWDAIEVWSQAGPRRLADVTAEFELEPGARPDAEHFVAVARRRVAVARADDTPAAADPRPDRLRRGAELLGAGCLREAFSVFAAVLREEPRSIPGLIGATHCALAADDTRSARSLLTRILALEPEHASARAALVELDRSPEVAS